GYAGIAPVKSFPPNGYGLYDMAGNVWEWCSDWYRPDYYKTLTDKGGVANNPQGPDSPLDPSEPNEKKRVHRGGSFLCNEQYCSRYIVGTRGKGEINTGTNHLGFRCVKSPGNAAREAVKSGFFADTIVGFGMARMYEALMEEATIQVRAFRERAAAAEWLGVPLEILEPA